MNGLRTVWLVARWEFTSTLRRPSFVASLIGLPLTHFVLAALIGFSVQTVSKEDSAQQPIAVVDAAALLSGAAGGEGPDRSRHGCCASRPAHGSSWRRVYVPETSTTFTAAGSTSIPEDPRASCS